MGDAKQNRDTGRQITIRESQAHADKLRRGLHTKTLGNHVSDPLSRRNRLVEGSFSEHVKRNYPDGRLRNWMPENYTVSRGLGERQPI